jgi:hypothetical protein
VSLIVQEKNVATMVARAFALQIVQKKKKFVTPQDNVCPQKSV